MKIKSKLSLTLGVTLQILMMSSLHAEFDWDDVNLEIHRKHYNNLPSVEESDAQLRVSTQFEPFLKKAEEVVVQYELEDSIGLRLIHRHFDLGEKQVMAENYELVKNVPSLVTYAHSIEEVQDKKALPASWIFSGNADQEALLFEASSDPEIRASSYKLQQNPEFFEEMNTLLRDHQLNNLLSVAILKRDSLVAKKGEIYVEANTLPKNKSIVQVWNKNNKSPDSIRTSWSFKGPRQPKCVRVSQCIPNDRGEHIVYGWHQ